MREHPIRLVASDDLERLRIAVFFRALLAVPHFIWLLLWSIVALLVAFPFVRAKAYSGAFLTTAALFAVFSVPAFVLLPTMMHGASRRVPA